MNHAKFRHLISLGRKLLWPCQTRKLANYTLYRLTIPFIRRLGPDRVVFSPPNVITSVTARCNKKCAFCYFDGELNSNNADRFELSYEMFIKIIAHPLVANSLRIGFSGGEPLLNKDLFKMVCEAKKRGHIVSVITNGLLLKRRFSEVIDSPPDLISVSYYPEDQEEIADTLELVVGRIPIRLNFMLSGNRIKYLEGLFQTAIKNNIRMVYIDPVYTPNSRNTGESPIQADDMLYRDLKTRMERIYGRKLWISWGPAGSDFRDAKPINCRVFWHSIHIDAMGSISPCCQWPLITYQGNIFTNPDLWNSRNMISFRRQMRKNKLPEFCTGCRLAYEDYLGI